jgi:hypothetical protein
MSRVLKSFDGLSLKVVGVATSDNTDVALPNPASSPPARSAAATTPLEQLTERRLDPLVDSIRWQHAGINE